MLGGHILLQGFWGTPPPSSEGVAVATSNKEGLGNLFRTRIKFYDVTEINFQVNGGRIGPRTQRWWRVFGEITTLVKSWRISQNRGRNPTIKGFQKEPN